jgi:riboflavin kinase, archaea type
MGNQEIKPSLLITLYKLIEVGAYPDEVIFTTTELAKLLGTSQQTASRHLIELEKNGLIHRVRLGRRESIKIVPAGAKHLDSMFLTLRRAFEMKKTELVFEGTVFSGLGEGAYYMSQEGYRKQFVEKLGFTPYPGTFNVRVRKEDQEDVRLLEASPFILIEGFTNGNRSFGPAKCFHGKIGDALSCALISPVRTHYQGDVVEIISSEYLRKALNAKDGDAVKVRAFSSVPQRASASTD